MSPQGGNQSLEEAIASVSSPEDFEAMMAEVQKNPNAFANPTTAVEDNSEQADAAATEVENSDNVDADQGEQNDDDEGKKYPQYRLRPTDAVDAEAMRIKKAADLAGSPISLADSIEIAKRKLGIASEEATRRDEPSYDDNSQVEEPDFTEGLTLADVKQELKDLRKQHSQALRNGDLDEAADVMDKITETEDLMEIVSEKESVRDQTQRQKHDMVFESSSDKAAELFPDFKDPNSEFFQRCREIDEALRDTNDPRYYDADKPLLVARIAAKELDIAPGRRAKSAAVTSAKPQPQTRVATSPQPPRTEKPGQLPAASGASRTSGAPTGAAASLVEQVARIKGPEEFERLARAVHGAIR